MEELFDALEFSESESGNDQKTEEESPDTIHALQSDPSVKTSKRRTMKILGKVGKQQVLILVDSGSIGTFVSEELVKRLKLATTPCTESTFKSADGGLMVCLAQVPELVWYAQGQTFSSTAKVLPLKCFDMIVGEDWLEDCSPMWIHWSNKIMKFTYQGKRIELHGVKQHTQCTAISYNCLQNWISREAVQHCIQFKWIMPREQEAIKS